MYTSGCIKKLCSLLLAGGILLAYSGVTALAQLSGTQYSTAGSAYSVTQAGSITVNSALRVLQEATAGVHDVTGHGGDIILTSTGGFIIITGSGSINTNALFSGFNGGSISLNAPTITVDGVLSANGLGSGSGGTVSMSGGTININSTAAIAANGGPTNGLAGFIDIDSTGITTIANGATLYTRGVTNIGGSNNLITIDGAGVNVNGLIAAQSNIGTGRGGRIAITTTGTELNVGSTGQMFANSTVDDGGEIIITGNLTNSGKLETNAANVVGANGGTITINGGGANYFVNQSGGEVWANGALSTNNSNGGSINVNTGSITLNGGELSAQGSNVFGLASGQGGTISLISSGNINVNNGAFVKVRGITGGNTSLQSTAGDINVNLGGRVEASGTADTILNINSNGDTTIAGVVEAGGWNNGHGGTLTINANASDVNIVSQSVVSSRGGQLTGTNGGTVNILGRDINLSGVSSGADVSKPNDAHVRAYGIQQNAGNTLGQGGVINFTATRNYNSDQYTNVGAGGVSVPAGASYSKSVININAGDTADIDGIYLVGGRQFTNSGGGLVNVIAANDVNVAATSHIGATDNSLTGLGGHGGRIDLTSTNGDVNVTGGAAVIGGTQRGLIDFSSGSAAGNGGLLNITANNGNVNFTNANLDGSGVGLGGQLIALTGGTLTVDALSNLVTSGISGASNNIIHLQGNTLVMNGTLTADSTISAGGRVNLYSNAVLNTGGFGGTYSVNGVAPGALIHLRGTAVNNTNNMTANNAEIRLEALTGNVTSTGDFTSDSVSFIANSGTVVASGDYTGTGDINATAQTIDVTATTGDMNMGDWTATAGTANAISTGGNVVASAGDTLSATGTFNLQSNNGNVVNGGAAVSGGTINLSAANGNITSTAGSYSGPIDGTAQIVSLTSDSGNLNLRNLAATAGDIVADADGGALSFDAAGTVTTTGTGTFRAGAGTIVSNGATISGTTGLNFSTDSDITLASGNFTDTGLRFYGGGGTLTRANNVTVTRAGGLNVSYLYSDGANALSTTGAGNNLVLSNANTLGTTTMQADNNVTATTNNFFGGAVQAYGDGGINDYLNNANITQSNTATTLNVTRLTTTTGNISTQLGSGAAGLTVSNAQFNNGITTFATRNGFTMSNSTVDGTDSVRVNSTQNGLITLSNNSIDQLDGDNAMVSGTNGMYIGSSNNYNLAGNTISGDMDINVTGNITSTSGSFGGGITAVGGIVSLTASAGSMDIQNVTTNTSAATLTTQAGDINVNGAINSAGTATLTAQNGNDINVLNDVTGTGITMSATGAGGTITVNGGDLTARLTNNIGGAVTMTSDGDMNFSSNNTLDASSGNNDALGGNVTLTSNNGAIITAGNFDIEAIGSSDATHSIVTLNGNSLTLNGDINTSGKNAGNGSSGGTINLTSDVGNINLTGGLIGIGYARNATSQGGGGNITINSAVDYFQSGGGYIDASSARTNRNLGNGAGYNNSGGNVTIIAGNEIDMTYNNGGNTLVNANGASNNGGWSNGGNGGTLTFTAGGLLDINHIGGGTPTYFTSIGGNGRFWGTNGGNGGNMVFTAAGAQVDDFVVGTNFQNTGGARGCLFGGFGCGANGANGTGTYNGGPVW